MYLRNKLVCQGMAVAQYIEYNIPYSSIVIIMTMIADDQCRIIRLYLFRLYLFHKYRYTVYSFIQPVMHAIICL